MSDFMSHYVVPIAIGAVAVVLVLGLINMMRGGSPNTSQRLMRLRVLLQFVAIIVIMATIWVDGRLAAGRLLRRHRAHIFDLFLFRSWPSSSSRPRSVGVLLRPTARRVAAGTASNAAMAMMAMKRMDVLLVGFRLR